MSATWRIIEGDCRDSLASLPERSVQTCVTSPPYFGLRDYGHDGQIGLEPTPDEFVQALVAVFREVRRVLRDDGTVWLNLGDSYTSGGRDWRAPDSKGDASGRARAMDFRPDTPAGMKPKDLIGIPWMVAFALRADGWYLRSDIIWAKPNPMPESVTDRPTKAHEYVFLLSKGPRYFYDADAIREDAKPESAARYDYAFGAGPKAATALDVSDNGLDRRTTPIGEREFSGQRNRRSVWTVATQPFAGAHFATFPPKLIEPCILAGCPERACSACGAPWHRIVERERQREGASPLIDGRDPAAVGHAAIASLPTAARTDASRSGMGTPSVQTLGFEPSCDCNADPTAGVVLDPFAGSGTTGMVALRHGRSFVGCELNPAYAALARHRIVDDAPLLNSHAQAA